MSAALSETEALRAECLRLRGALFDPVTRLPSLAAVLDTVRRSLESDQRLVLFYFDLAGDGHLEPARGWQSHDEALAAAARTLREFGASRGDICTVSQLGVRSDQIFLVVSDLVREAVAPLHETLREGVATALGQTLPSRHGPPARAEPDGSRVEIASFESAVVEIRLDPAIRAERSIYSALRRAHTACRERDGERRRLRRQELERMLGESDIVVRYQPIVELSTGDLHGLEALSGAPTVDPFDSSETLFTFAEENGGIVELERLCRREALRGAAPLLAGGEKLFVNCSAHAFVDPDLVPSLVAAAEVSGTSLGDIVLEVTERVAILEWDHFQKSLRAARDAGVQVAIDDMGAGYSSLRAVGEIEPEYLKFDRSLIHGINQSPIKRDLLDTLVTLAGKIGARAIAEGIETEDELACVRDCGVRLGQGYLFSRPRTASELAG